MLESKPCRNVPPDSADDIRRLDEAEVGVTFAFSAETSPCGFGGGVTLLVRGRFNRRVCVGGDRTGVLGVAFRLLLGVSSLEFVRFALFAALSTEDFAASNMFQALSSSGSLIAAGGVSPLFDCPDSLLVALKYAAPELLECESRFIQRILSSCCRCVKPRNSPIASSSRTSASNCSHALSRILAHALSHCCCCNCRRLDCRPPRR
jgi:hypothetical protein